ncbi:MAG: hypothetical protein FWC87_16500 [Acidimicrobiaceae bacterium]|nr:hypothetical protein [Acidimicrobiaceae bacterium]
MTYPYLMTAMAKEHERDLLERGRRRRLVREARAASPRGPGLRERVGWRLVDLGVHLVMYPGRREPATSA